MVKHAIVLGMVGGVGQIVKRALMEEKSSILSDMYQEFVQVIDREYNRVFGSEENVLGGNIPFMFPNVHIPTDSLEDWSLSC